MQKAFPTVLKLQFAFMYIVPKRSQIVLKKPVKKYIANIQSYKFQYMVILLLYLTSKITSKLKVTGESIFFRNRFRGGISRIFRNFSI